MSTVDEAGGAGGKAIMVGVCARGLSVEVPLGAGEGPLPVKALMIIPPIPPLVAVRD